MAAFAGYEEGWAPADPSPPPAPTFHKPTVLEVDGWLFKKDEEIAAVKALQERLADLDEESDWQCDSLSLDPRVLVRFCRARKLDLDKAEAMFREAKEWRKVRRPDRVASEWEMPEVLQRFATGGLLGRDKQGSPVFYDRIGMVDPRGLLDRATVLDLEKRQVKQEETITQALKLATAEDPQERVQIQLMVVQDVTGLSRSHMYRPGLDALKRILWIVDHVYPERLKKMMIINAPWIFSAIWMIVKYFIDPVTREKIEIYSGPETQRLLELIDAEQLPAYLGGSHPDGDANPPVLAGGKIPEECPKSADKHAEEARAAGKADAPE